VRNRQHTAERENKTEIRHLSLDPADLLFLDDAPLGHFQSTIRLCRERRPLLTTAIKFDGDDGHDSTENTATL
jgi:hypothetical protein